MSGNICAATNSPSPCSKATTISSTNPAPHGTSSPTTPNASPQSHPELGRRSILEAVGIRTLLDHLNDAARARFDQHGLAVHDGVAIGRDAVGLRHVVIGDAGFGQHAADDHAIRNSVVRHPFAHDVFA